MLNTLILKFNTDVLLKRLNFLDTVIHQYNNNNRYNSLSQNFFRSIRSLFFSYYTGYFI